MNKEEEFQQAFEQTVRQDMRFYDKGQIDWLKLSKTDAPCHVIQLGVICNTKYVSLEEYCDWFNTQPTDVITVVAERLGHMCASTYNALVGNAMRKYGVGVHIVDLFENTEGQSLVDTNQVMDETFIDTIFATLLVTVTGGTSIG